MKTDHCLLFIILTFQTISFTHCAEIILNKCNGASLEPNNQNTIQIPEEFMANEVAKTFSLSPKGKTLNCKTHVAQANATEEIKFIETGEVQLDSGYYNVEDYCIQSFESNKTEFTINYCEPDCGKSQVCIAKCCHLNQAIDVDTPNYQFHCNSTGHKYRNWVPHIYNEKEYTRCGRKEVEIRPHFVRYNLPCDAPEPYFAKMITFENETLSEGERFRLLRNGSLVINIGPGEWKVIDEGEFCIDAMQNYDSASKHYNGDPTDQAIFICRNPITNSTSSSKLRISIPYIYASLMIFGAVFLFLTAIVYLLLWDKHNIHGWTIFCFDVSMFFMFVFLAAAHLAYEHLDSDDIGSVRCTAIGILAHYFFLASFSWMTVINVDLWWTFKNMSPSSGKSKGIQKFGLYMAFAWAIPLIIVGFAIIVDKQYNIHEKLGECDVELPIVLPKYGTESCYLSEKARGYYLYLPIALLLCCNLILFSSTVWTLWIYKQSTKQAVRGNSNNQKQSFIIFIKLFFVMGISWIFELISWYFTSDGSNPIWIIFDILNLLSPLAIFYIFVCKREIIIMLYQKYPIARGMLQRLSLLPCCKMGLADTEATEMTGADKSRVLHHKRRSSSSVSYN